MPRPEREDIEPLVWIEPHPKQEKVKEVTDPEIGPYDEVTVRDTRLYGRERYFYTYYEELEHFEDLCKELKTANPEVVNFDYRIFFNSAENLICR